jgi:heterodisulfide reductase subunit A-like polyferredoxin
MATGQRGKEEKQMNCIVCGSDFRQTYVGKPKKYCSRNCSMKNSKGSIIINEIRKRTQDPIHQARKLGLVEMKYYSIYRKNGEPQRYRKEVIFHD